MKPWRLVNVVIGDPANPDLVADWLEARTAVGLSGPYLTGVRGGHVRLRARWVDGRLSLGSIDRLRPVTTAYTISLDTPAEMAAAAAKAAQRPILKIKLGAPEGDVERIEAVRRAAPDATLIADANEGWTEDNVALHLQACASAGFVLIEQPLRAGEDSILAEIPHPVPICADESVHDRHDLAHLKGRYDAINIKLDKAGGLTEALALAEAAQKAGFGIMVGCMLGSSLAMAPAMLLTPRARFVDLDAPLLLARDREPGLAYTGSLVSPPSSEVWG